MDYWLLAGIAALILLIGGLFYALRSTQVHSPGGFRDWVKNPGYRQFAAEEAARYIAARDAIEVSDEIADDEIQAMVERLFEKENRDFNLERLEKVGQRALPLLLKAIRDLRAVKQFREPMHIADPRTPFERICRLIAPLRSPDVPGRRVTVAAISLDFPGPNG